MQKIKGILGFFKIIIKYASFVVVIIDIVNYAIDRLEKELPKEAPTPQLDDVK